MKYGRRRPVGGAGPHLKLRNYLRATQLPAPPTTLDMTAKAMASLSKILLNDSLGDCVVAGGYHVTGALTGNASGTPFVPTDAQVIADYSAIGGYVPGDPSTDQGCDEPTAFRYWTSHGFANGTKLLQAIAVDPTNVNELQLAMWLFGNLFYALELPDAYEGLATGDGFVWPVSGPPNSQKGHCIVSPAKYDATRAGIATWGMVGWMTYEAIATYCTEAAGGALYTLLSPDELAKGMSIAPNGIDWPSLLADFDAIGGSVPIPAPMPPPPVPPATGPTLDGASAAIAAGLNSGHWLMTRAQAVSEAAAALKAYWPAGAP